MASWPASASASAALPAAISDCALSGATGSTLTVTFSPITRNILSYQERHAINGSGGWSSPATIVSGGTIGGLTGSTNYDVQVRGVGPLGAGDWSNTDTEATTGGVLPGTQSAPGVSQASSSALTVNFTAASNAVSHEERHAPKIPHSTANVSTGWWSEPATITDGSNIAGLDPLIEYEVQTRGVNGVGNGAWSSSGTASTATASSTKNGISTSNSTMGNAADNVLYFGKWTFSGSPNVLTYSFPQAASNYTFGQFGGHYDGGDAKLTGFAGFNSTQADFVRRALFYYQQITPIKYVEITEDDTTHADLRYAISDDTDGDGTLHNTVATSFYPSTSASGGDTFFDPSYVDFAIGNYPWKALLHEMGHAHGLKHPTDSGGGGTTDQTFEFTVMPQGASPGTWDSPQSLMRLDIQALQFKYGARTDHTGDRNYTWSPTNAEFQINGVNQWTPGANKIFQTIWDGGTNDTYDFTGGGYTGGTITADLDPGDGTVTASAQLALVGAGNASANIYNAYDSDIDAANTA